MQSHLVTACLPGTNANEVNSNKTITGDGNVDRKSTAETA